MGYRNYNTKTFDKHYNIVKIYFKDIYFYSLTCEILSESSSIYDYCEVYDIGDIRNIIIYEQTKTQP